jgi:protein-disulfide isomerase
VLLAILVGALAWLTACGGTPLSGPAAQAPSGVEPADVTPEATIAPTEAPQPTAEAAQSAPADDLLPQPSTAQLDGIPVGFTKGGYPYRGNPNAKVVVVEFSEFQCPYCGRYESETAPQITDTYVKTDKVLQIFRHFPLREIHAQAEKASESAICAGEQGADRFWAMHDLLFQHQQEWSGKSDAVDLFKGYATELKLDGTAFDECLDSGRTAKNIDADLAAGEAQGVGGTPSFFLNGYPLVGAQPFTAFQAVIDAQVAGNPPPTPEPQKAEIPFWATADGMAPDPARPGYDKAGDAYMGDARASVVMIEFSDYQ